MRSQYPDMPATSHPKSIPAPPPDNLSPALHFDDVSRHFAVPGGLTYPALQHVSFTVASREFLAIVGPTGCGKSTILSLAAGLLRASSGRILTFGKEVKAINRQAAYLFQQDVLLPWKTALDNVMLGPLLHRWPHARASEEARRWLARVGLVGFENRFPHQLSGGMRKRVALAQSLIVGPAILLMDEPFSALDVQTREVMENDLLALWQEDRKTILFVTHDLEEAIALSDRVLVLAAGPGTQVIGSHPVTLPRPRDVTEVRLHPGFRQMYQTIWAQLRGEVLRAYAAQERAGAGA